MATDTAELTIQRLEQLSNDEGLLQDLTRVLIDRGIEGFEITEFSVSPVQEGGRVRILDTSCPTRCRRRPDGTIECREEC